MNVLSIIASISSRMNNLFTSETSDWATLEPIDKPFTYQRLKNGTNTNERRKYSLGWAVMSIN